MDLKLAGKVALISAASRGLGYATALALAAEGAKLAICSRQSSAIHTAAENIKKLTGTAVLPVTADLSNPADVRKFVDTALTEYGTLDMAFLNTGGPKPGNFLDLTPEDWETAAQTTLHSMIQLAYAVVPIMRAQQNGSILINTSVTVKEPLDNLILSNSLRMAVIGLVKSLANEVGPDNVRVNAIAPGWTRTERIDALLQARMERSHHTLEEEMAEVSANVPLRRIGSPDEFGTVAAFLLSPAASYITGVTLLVDGGMSKTAL
ncbi:MAG: SDR family oxidoreductase [Anaerolineales bacterium]|nr:MAG: SDR family oxidoreductase [Anaerolineales bacterium]